MNRTLLEELKNNADGDISQETANRLILSALGNLCEKVDDFSVIMSSFDERIETLEENPSLVYLLRFHTVKTASWLITIFAGLSAWFVSDFRQWLLEAAGLPAHLLPPK